MAEEMLKAQVRKGGEEHCGTQWCSCEDPLTWTCKPFGHEPAEQPADPLVAANIKSHGDVR